MTVAANGLGRLLGGRRRWPRWFLLALLCRGQARGGWRPRAQPFLGVGAGGDGWGPAMSEVTRSLLQRWGASFRRGADFDSWGQLVEAIDENQILARHLQKEAQAQHNNSEFTEEQKVP